MLPDCYLTQYLLPANSRDLNTQPYRKDAPIPNATVFSLFQECCRRCNLLIPIIKIAQWSAWPNDSGVGPEKKRSEVRFPRGRVVKELDPRSRGLRFDSRVAEWLWLDSISRGLRFDSMNSRNLGLALDLLNLWLSVHNGYLVEREKNRPMRVWLTNIKYNPIRHCT